MGMNTLPVATQALILRCLVEGNSLASTQRTANVSKNTVLKLLVDAGRACSEYQDETLRDLPCRRIQVDEIWSFVYAKQGNLPKLKQPPHRAGDAWTWTAICAETKLVPSWLVGDRGALTAHRFIDDLRGRLAHRVQLTSDGHKPYLEAVERAFRGDVDYAMLQKLYGSDGGTSPEKKYSPGKCNGSKRHQVSGRPDPRHVSTSYVERQNLTMRMSMRRFTRLTNAFSKKIENHVAMVSLHFMHYNFCRPHISLQGRTPAMAAGVASHVWTIEEIVELVNAARPKPGPRGKYQKRISN